MSYYAEGYGYIRFKNGTDAKTISDVKSFLSKNCFHIEDLGRYEFDIDISYYANYWEDEVLEVLNSINNYIETGFMDFTGEDGEHWRYKLDDKEKRWFCLQGQVIYEISDILPKEQIELLAKAVSEYINSGKISEKESKSFEKILEMINV